MSLSETIVEQFEDLVYQEAQSNISKDVIELTLAERKKRSDLKEKLISYEKLTSQLSDYYKNRLNDQVIQEDIKFLFEISDLEVPKKQQPAQTSKQHKGRFWPW